MSVQSQWPVTRKNTSIPLDRRSIEALERAGVKASGRERLRPRSYLSPDGTGWSFQRLFDPRKTWTTLRAEMPHTLDFGLQTLSDKHSIKFMIFWPGHDPKGIAFPIELWRRDGPGSGVRDYAELVLEIARCYDAFFRFHKERSSLPQWDIKANPEFMVENLGLVEIRHAGVDVFYADVEYQPNVRVPTAAAPAPCTGIFPPSTETSAKNDPVFKTPTRVRGPTVDLLWSYMERFPYPSEEQCMRLVDVLGYDVILIKLWFENNRKKYNGVKVAPTTRLQAALAVRKQQEAKS